MKKVCVILLALFLINCTSDDGNTNGDNVLIGKWKLIEQLVDPGDGSGTFQTVTSDRVIEFFNDGTVKVNGELCFMSTETGDESMGTFKKTSSNNTDIQNDGYITPDNCDFSETKIYFDLPSSGNLILWYLCIEGCGQKFKKI